MDEVVLWLERARCVVLLRSNGVVVCAYLRLPCLVVLAREVVKCWVVVVVLVVLVRLVHEFCGW